MKPVKQRFRHKPAEGIIGDCHRAAIASILELDLDDVPHFAEDDPPADVFHHRCREWLFSQGITPVDIIFDGSSLEDVLTLMHHLNPNLHYILGGKSKNGCGHSVVACNGKIVHDPALDESGIVGPMSDGYYWITVFGDARALMQDQSQLQEAA
jgi:hypothetical protein